MSTQGNTTIGNASGDDLTVTASLASSIPVKTTNSYDIGSATIGLRSVYIASDDSAAKTVRILAGTVGTSYTLTLPTSGGTNRYFLETNGSGVTTWALWQRSPEASDNYSLAASVASNILTITLNGADGNAISTTNPVNINFRNATASTGTVTNVLTTAASLTLAVSSGSTLGHASAKNHYIFVYAINNAGTVELAISGKLIADGSIATTTSLAGGGGDDSATTFYSTTGRSNVAVKLIGRMKSNQTTAGTWAAVPTEIYSGRAAALMPIVAEVSLSAGNGFGSTNTLIRKYTTVSVDTGDITQANSATLGASVTIQVPGYYSLERQDGSNGTASYYWGISKNGTVGTGVTSLTYGTVRVASAHVANVNNDISISTVQYLDIGDIIRPHDENGTAGDHTAAYDSWFRVKWISWGL